MTITQNECFVELSSFDDLARYACAFREYLNEYILKI